MMTGQSSNIHRQFENSVMLRRAFCALFLYPHPSRNHPSRDGLFMYHDISGLCSFLLLFVYMDIHYAYSHMLFKPKYGAL